MYEDHGFITGNPVSHAVIHAATGLILEPANIRSIRIHHHSHCAAERTTEECHRTTLVGAENHVIYYPVGPQCVDSTNDPGTGIIRQRKLDLEHYGRMCDHAEVPPNSQSSHAFGIHHSFGVEISKMTRWQACS